MSTASQIKNNDTIKIKSLGLWIKVNKVEKIIHTNNNESVKVYGYYDADKFPNKYGILSQNIVRTIRSNTKIEIKS